MSRDVIEIEWVCAGQPRPYADSVYEAFLTWRREGLLPDGRGSTAYYVKPNETLAKSLARTLVHGWADDPDWHEPRLDFIRPAPVTDEMRQRAHEKWNPSDHARWHVRVVQPYLD